MNIPILPFMLRDGEWQVRVGNIVLPTIWNSRGAAQAGGEVELRRQSKTNPRPIDPSPFTPGENYVVSAALLGNLWRLAQVAGNYGLSHGENRDLQNLIGIVADEAVILKA
jgi:hypothetical protein